MRRKLFFAVILITAVIAFADMAGIIPEDSRLSRIAGEEARYTGRVEAVERKDGGYKLAVRLDDWAGIKIFLSYYGRLDDPEDLYKRTIEFTAAIEKPQGRRNPGCFDYGKYLKSCGIQGTAIVDSFEVVYEDDLPWNEMERRLMKQKQRFIEEVPQDAGGLVAGILFGDTSRIEEETYEAFRINGTAHVLAVSGLHMGILYAMLNKVLRACSGRIRFLAIGTVLLAAGTLASWSPSVTRAAGMITIKTVAEICDRRYDTVTAMSAVAMALIVRNPYVIFNAGFQMSFLAALSISFFMPHISKRIPDFAAVTLAAGAGLTPYQMFCFNSLSFTSLAANIPVVYLVGILMPLAALSFCLSCMGITSPAMMEAVHALANLTEKINAFSAMGGRGAIGVTSPPLWAVALFYMAAFFLASETFEILRLRRLRKKIGATLLIFCAVSSAIGLMTFCPVAKDDVVFVDVGQGDCVHIRAEGKNILIDGGGNINYNVGKNILKPYLLKNGCSKADMALATHLHTDHYKGIEELAEEGMIDSVRTAATAGSSFEIAENVVIETLWPLKIISNQDENENCSVFMVTYEGYKILITGDLDEEGERELMRLYEGTDKLKADILKIGHHGSGGSTCDDFLKTVDPDVCVIQVGKNNYGHPHPKVIEKCRENCIMIFRTDIHGAVGFSFGQDMEYHKMTEEKG